MFDHFPLGSWKRASFSHCIGRLILVIDHQSTRWASAPFPEVADYYGFIHEAGNKCHASGANGSSVNGTWMWDDFPYESGIIRSNVNGAWINSYTRPFELIFDDVSANQGSVLSHFHDIARDFVSWLKIRINYRRAGIQTMTTNTSKASLPSPPPCPRRTGQNWNIRTGIILSRSLVNWSNTIQWSVAEMPCLRLQFVSIAGNCFFHLTRVKKE